MYPCWKMWSVPFNTLHVECNILYIWVLPVWIPCVARYVLYLHCKYCLRWGSLFFYLFEIFGWMCWATCCQKQSTPIVKLSHNNFKEQNGSGEENIYMYIWPNVFTLERSHIFKLHYTIEYVFFVNYQRNVRYFNIYIYIYKYINTIYIYSIVFYWALQA